MIKYAVVIAAVAGICSAMPAGAEEAQPQRDRRTQENPRRENTMKELITLVQPAFDWTSKFSPLTLLRRWFPWGEQVKLMRMSDQTPFGGGGASRKAES